MHNIKEVNLLSPTSKSINETKDSEIRDHEKISKKRKMIMKKFNSLNNTINDCKRDSIFNPIIKLDAASERNLTNKFVIKEAFKVSFLIEDKSLIKHFGRNWTFLSKAQINLALAQQIVKSLPRLNSFDSIKDSHLNKINLNAYKKVIHSLKYFASEEIKELLYKVVLESRQSDLISLAASNCMYLRISWIS